MLLHIFSEGLSCHLFHNIPLKGEAQVIISVIVPRLADNGRGIVQHVLLNRSLSLQIIRGRFRCIAVIEAGGIGQQMLHGKRRACQIRNLNIAGISG
ncbi:hypothetical protein D3C75_953740 [compost metagenome]